MRFDILTIFPGLFESFKSEALIARAIKKRIITVKAHDLRRWTDDAHRTVDDRPYGGGAGMVLMVAPILKALNALRKVKSQKPVLSLSNGSKVKSARQKSKVILFSAKGKTFNQSDARRLSKYDQLIFICGRYEGVDERVAAYLADEELSIGNYVLFGGEVPAMVVTEAITRLLPGAIGKQASLDAESFNPVAGIEKKMITDFLEYPHYTRPASIVIKGRRRLVPKALLTGHHKLVADWRKRQSSALMHRRKK